MSTYMGETTKVDKMFYVALGIFMLAFLAYVPFMIADKQARLDKEWHDKGCQMYDTEKVAELPAKCNNDFTDHYKSQALRNQPPLKGE